MNALTSISKRIALFLILSFLYNLSFAQCHAGILQTTGTVDVPDEETFSTEVTDIVIPFPDGNFAWIFSNEYTNGTGGPNEYFVMTTNAPENNFDNTLNNYVNLNNLPRMTGTWVLFGAVVEDKFDAENTICDVTTDSLIINFAEVDNDCTIGEMITIGEEDICFGKKFNLTKTLSYTSPNGGYGWLFSNTNTNGTGANGENFIIKSNELSTDYNNDLNGYLSSNNQPVLEGTWIVYGAIFLDGDDPINSICQFTSESLILNLSTDIIVTTNYDSGEFDFTATGGTPPYETYIIIDITEVPFENRIGIRDANGCKSSASYPLELPTTVSIEDKEIVHQFSIFPNPISDGQLNVNLQLNANKNIKIDFMSVDGKMIQSFINENSKGDNYRFDITDLATGLYFLKVNIEGQQFMEKVIIP